MAFKNPAQDEITSLLQSARTIAVPGLSDDSSRPSFGVALAMQRYGYRIIPVNPALTTWQGIKAIPDLEHLPEVLQAGEKVDIVDVFRQPRHVQPIVDSCLRLGIPALWLQLGVVNEAAAERARTGGMKVVMDKCIYVERAKLGEGRRDV